MTISAYLAGPIDASDDNGVGWREMVTDRHPEIDWRDPTDWLSPDDDVEVGPDGDISCAELVRDDKDAIYRSDAVLVGYRPIRQIGTPMEAMYAHEVDIPVVMWVRSLAIRDSDISPWYRAHCDSMHWALSNAVERLEEVTA